MIICPNCGIPRSCNPCFQPFTNCKEIQSSCLCQAVLLQTFWWNSTGQTSAYHSEICQKHCFRNPPKMDHTFMPFSFSFRRKQQTAHLVNSQLGFLIASSGRSQSSTGVDTRESDTVAVKVVILIHHRIHLHSSSNGFKIFTSVRVGWS